MKTTTTPKDLLGKNQTLELFRNKIHLAYFINTFNCKIFLKSQLVILTF